MLEKLTREFPDEALEVIKTKEYTTVSVKPQALIQRLNDVLGTAWNVYHKTPLHGQHHVQIEVTVDFGLVKRSAFGAAPIEAARVDIAVKSAETNGFVRACALLGMAATIEQVARLTAAGSVTDRAMEHLRKSVEAAVTDFPVIDRKEEERSVAAMEVEQPQDELLDSPESADEKGEAQPENDTKESEVPPAGNATEEVDYIPMQADIEAAEAFENKIGSDIVTIGMQEWNVIFYKALFGGDYTGGEIRSILLGLRFKGFNVFSESTKRFTVNAGMRFYNDFFQKTESWCNRQLDEYLKEMKVQEVAGKQTTDEQEKEFEAALEVVESAPAPSEQPKAPTDTKQDDEGPASAWDVKLQQKRSENDSTMDEMFDIINDLEAVGITEDNWKDEVPTACHVCFGEIIEFAEWAPMELVQRLMEWKNS